MLKWLIQEQEIHGKVNEFWSVWEALKPKMLELSHEKNRYYYTDYNGPIGKDRVIASYLFANSEWRENIYRCTLLSEERKEFLMILLHIRVVLRQCFTLWLDYLIR